MEADVPFIFEEFSCTSVPAEAMDALWQLGWRHFGPVFFRYSHSALSGELRAVQPLRVALDRYSPSKSQRRIAKRNAELRVATGPPVIDATRHRLFENHKARFKDNVPDSIASFLGASLADYPCECVEFAAYEDDRLIAASYLDVGKEGASSVYAMFDPAHARRGLGIATMLWEIEYAARRGCRFYYPGYAFHERSVMDYKKQFAGTEWFDWKNRWLTLERAGD